MSTIIEVMGREILDSRGNPTLEAEVTLASGGTTMMVTLVESLTGGSSTDAVSLGNQGNTINVSLLETLMS